MTATILPFNSLRRQRAALQQSALIETLSQRVPLDTENPSRPPTVSAINCLQAKADALGFPITAASLEPQKFSVLDSLATAWSLLVRSRVGLELPENPSARDSYLHAVVQGTPGRVPLPEEVTVALAALAPAPRPTTPAKLRLAST